MKFENPEYLGLMYLHAGRYHLKELLKKGFTPERARALRPMLPYSIITDGNGLPGTTNRSYNALGTPGPARYDFCWPNYPTFHFPKEKSRLWTKDREQTWIYAGASAPWMSREAAEYYLDQLESFIDFSTEDLEDVANA